MDTAKGIFAQASMQYLVGMQDDTLVCTHRQKKNIYYNSRDYVTPVKRLAVNNIL